MAFEVGWGRYVQCKQNQIIVYLFEENGFSIVFMGLNSGLSWLLQLVSSKAIIDQGWIFFNSLLFIKKENWLRYRPIACRADFFILFFSVLLFYYYFFFIISIFIPEESVEWSPARGQIPMFLLDTGELSWAELVVGRSAAGSFNQHLGPCFTNSVQCHAAIFRLSTQHIRSRYNRPAQNEGGKGFYEMHSKSTDDCPQWF